MNKTIKSPLKLKIFLIAKKKRIAIKIIEKADILIKQRDKIKKQLSEKQKRNEDIKEEYQTLIKLNVKFDKLEKEFVKIIREIIPENPMFSENIIKNKNKNK